MTISFLSFSQIGDAADDRRHAATVLRGGNQLLAALVDAETGQRGYLLTGDEAYLEPYLAVRNNVADRLKALARAHRGARSRPSPGCHGAAGGRQAGLHGTRIDLRRSGDLRGGTRLTATR